MSDVSRAGGPLPINNTYAQSDDKSVATVQVGENKLSDVAGRLGVDPKDLQKANPQFSDTSVLKAGQELKIPQNPGSQGPREARDREDDGVRNKTSQPPSYPLGDPLVKGFVQSKLDSAGEKTKFSEKDLGQLSGGSSSGKLQSEYSQKIHLEDQAHSQKGGDYQWIKDKVAEFAKYDVSPQDSQAFGKESLSHLPGQDLSSTKYVDKSSPLVADKPTPLDKSTPLLFEKVQGGGPSETVSPDYSKVKMSYEPQKDGTTGTASGPGQQGFDILKLKPW